MTKTKIQISHPNSIEQIFLSTSKDGGRSIFNNNKKKDKMNRNNVCHLDSYSINYLLFQYILLILLKAILSYTSPIPYITLQVKKIGEQQIFSDKFDINGFYPFKIYVNNELQILRNKKVFVESPNDTIKIEWTHTNKNMSYMFANLQDITSIILNNMLNSKGENNTSNMFYNRKNLEEFNFTGTNTNYEINDVSKMFYNCSSLTSISFKGKYGANNVNTSYMFYNCINLREIYFDSNLFVNDMRYMYYNCYNFSSIDLSKFYPVSNGKKEVNMSYLFYNCYKLSSIIKTHQKILVNDMRFMFYNCSKFQRIEIDFLVINNSTNMSYIFYDCQILNNIIWGINYYDMSHPSDMRSMFYNCFKITNIILPFYNESLYVNMTRMFYNCSKLTYLEFKYGSIYYPSDMQAMFYNCKTLKNLNLGDNIKTDYVEDMSFLFYNCSALISLNIIFSNKLTKNIRGIFLNCNSLISLNLDSFYTHKVEIMWDMFKGCSKLKNLYLGNFDTSKVTDMESMFEGCSSLTTLSLLNFDTSNVQFMNKMFKDCTALTSLNFKNIKTNSLGTMHQMFYNCKQLKYLNLYDITEKGQSYEEMFDKASNDFVFCIKENENIPNIFMVLLNITKATRDCSEHCYGSKRVNIPEKKLCCPFFKYKDNCYDKCPRKTKVINQVKICEDFNCTNKNEYYNYEQSACITDIRGFYINDSFAKTIDKCHEDCSECKGRWTENNTNCSVCADTKPYIYLGNCYKNCTPGFYQENTDKYKCKCFNTKCELCSEESLEFNLCETCNQNYYPIQNDPKNFKSWKNCYQSPINYFLENGVYKPCYSSCEFCTKAGNYDFQFCLSCNNDTSFALQMDEPNNSTFNCYPNCSYYYYFDENKKYHCTTDPVCPEEYRKLIYNDRRCIKSCLEHKTNKYEYQNICYEKCPPDRSYNMNDTDYFCKITCPFERPFEMVKLQICVSNCTIMERKDKLCVTNYRGNRSNDEVQDKVLANLQEDIIDTFDYHYVNENVSIILEEIGNTYEILTTNKKEDESKTSDIIFGKCETTLKNFYSIDPNEPLYILKLDAYREGMQNPKVIYIVYYPLNEFKLEQLDLTLCEGDGISLLFSANLTDDEDLYNKNSGYYNDVCYTYTSDDGTDMSLLDRQQEYADNNKSLCEEGCEFVKYHADQEKAECSCNVKVNVPLVSEIKIDKDLLYNFVDIKKLMNFDVMKCYKLLLDTKGLIKNIGVYIFLPTLISFFICLILFFRMEYDLLKKNVNEIVEAKEIFKYLLETGKIDENLNNNIKVNYFHYDDDPVNLIKMKNMKLPKFLMDRNIINQTNINKNNKNKIKIKIKRKIKSKQLVLRKDLVHFKKDIKEDEGNKGKNEIQNFSDKSSDINTNIQNENYVCKKINIDKTKESDKKRDSKNAPPLKDKRSIKNERNIITQRNEQIRDLSVRRNLMETGRNQNDLEEKKRNDLDMIHQNKSNISNEEKQKIKNILDYNHNELNSMDYIDALKYDHRSFFEFYFALLKSKHLLLTLIETRDYNSRIIKIYLIFFNFASCYAINALFFDDDTMHKIYEDKGNYNILAQLPQIIYSTIISSFFDGLLNFLALSEDDIINIKQEKEMENIGTKKDDVLRGLHIKFIIFFILSFLLLLLFWYYTTCFCAVYKNTQYHLLKDTLISFATSMGTPFIICFLPSIFRTVALKRKSKSHRFLYGLNKFIQFF